MARKRITRAQSKAWLRPIRAAFSQVLTGEVDAINGYAVTRLHDGDDYARLEYCIAGFRALIDRLLPDYDTAPLRKIEARLANGVPLERSSVEACLTLLKQVESALLRFTAPQVKDAVLAEQIVIELEQLGLKEAA